MPVFRLINFESFCSKYGPVFNYLLIVNGAVSVVCCSTTAAKHLCK